MNIIPSTQGATTISAWKPGTVINMETDVLGKYVLRMLGPWQDAQGKKESKISEAFLRENGF